MEIYSLLYDWKVCFAGIFLKYFVLFCFLRQTYWLQMIRIIKSFNNIRSRITKSFFSIYQSIFIFETLIPYPPQTIASTFIWLQNAVLTITSNEQKKFNIAVFRILINSCLQVLQNGKDKTAKIPPISENFQRCPLFLKILYDRVKNKRETESSLLLNINDVIYLIFASFPPVPQFDCKNSSEAVSSILRSFCKTLIRIARTDFDQRFSKLISLPNGFYCCFKHPENDKNPSWKKSHHNMLCSISICRHLVIFLAPLMILDQSKLRMLKKKLVHLTYKSNIFTLLLKLGNIFDNMLR